MSLSNLIFGSLNYQETERFIEEYGGPENVELTKEVLPYARTAYNLFLLGRVILLLISLKYPKLSKIFFYYEQMDMVIGAFLPYYISYGVKM